MNTQVASHSSTEHAPLSAGGEEILLRCDVTIPLKLGKPCLGELVFTSEALYFISKGVGSRFSHAVGGGLIGGIARAAGEAKDRKARAAADAAAAGKSLQELMAEDEHSFVAPISEIEELRFSLMWGNSLKTKSRKVRIATQLDKATKAEIKAWCERFGVAQKGLK